MKQIWAPWRKRYVTLRKHRAGCIFCRDWRAPVSHDRKNLVVYRSRLSLIVLNLFPYNNGHLMVVPRRHVPTLEKLNARERLDLLSVIDLSLKILRKAFHPEGFNLGVNLGRAGGAGILGHVHLHVVPRWEGDTNFMPVITGAKVISDSLEGTYRLLRRLLKK